jgi:cardiolipin synthase C
MMRRPRAVAAVIALLGTSVLLPGCTTLRSHYTKNPSSALPPQFDTATARSVQAKLAQHPGKSGFRLLLSSTDALMSRIWLIDHARHSLDLQYFIFQNDATGRLVAQHLLTAADRGVRVRLLLDDIALKHEERLLDALDADPHIQVRLFNPFRTRNPSMASKIVQLALEGRRLNRRMHNKSFIVDGLVAVIGGRNIGDPYFDAGSDNNFRDLDLIIIGPVVGEAAQAFDEYWNSDAACPLDAYPSAHNARAELSQLRPELRSDVREFAQSDYAKAVLEELPNGATGARPGTWLWGDATLLADQPQKIDSIGDDPALRIGPQIRQMVQGAQRELLLISPYFIPSEQGARFLTRLAARGVAVKVLTNSLASTDEPAAEAGYSHHRRALLEGGVQLYELRPVRGAKQRATAAGTSAGVSLHAKAIVVDQHFVFVGSMNLDPRSKLLNTEMGVRVDSPELAQEVARFFERGAAPASAFHVQLGEPPGAAGSGEHMFWSWDAHGVPVTAGHDPGVRGSRWLEFEALRLLPIEGLL